MSVIATVDYLVRSICIPIASNGGGVFYCLDVEKIVDDDYPVVFRDTALPDAEFHKPPVVAKSFAAYLKKLLNDAPGL